MTIDPELSEVLSARRLTPTVIPLLMYRHVMDADDGESVVALRSSIRRRDDGVWHMDLHQSTRVIDHAEELWQIRD